MKKAQLEACFGGLVSRLGNRDTLTTLIDELLEYAASLDNVGQLSQSQEEALAEAQALVDTQHGALVGLGIISQSAFDAIAPDASGASLQQALATIAAMTGSDDMQRQHIVADSIPSLLAVDGIVIPLTVTAEGASLGIAKKTRSGGNADRPSVKTLPIGLKNSVFKAYGKVWHQIFTCPSGWRVFNLTTREELSDPGALPQSSSAAQKLVTVFGDAFRGYSKELPPDVGVVALEASEIPDVVAVAVAETVA